MVKKQEPIVKLPTPETEVVVVALSRERMAIFGEIHTERQRQDEQWGGPAHDDEHAVSNWLTFIDYQMQRARHAYIGPHFIDGDVQIAELRSRFVKIAALAVASIESIDRGEK